MSLREKLELGCTYFFQWYNDCALCEECTVWPPRWLEYNKLGLYQNIISQPFWVSQHFILAYSRTVKNSVAYKAYTWIFTCGSSFVCFH